MQVRVIEGVNFKIDKLKYDQFVPDCKSFLVFHFIKKTGLDLKIFQCKFGDNCKKTFCNLYKLFDHIRSHTGERPFKC